MTGIKRRRKVSHFRHIVGIGAGEPALLWPRWLIDRRAHRVDRLHDPPFETVLFAQRLTEGRVMLTREKSSVGAIKIEAVKRGGASDLREDNIAQRDSSLSATVAALLTGSPISQRAAS